MNVLLGTAEILKDWETVEGKSCLVYVSVWVFNLKTEFLTALGELKTDATLALSFFLLSQVVEICVCAEAC